METCVAGNTVPSSWCSHIVLLAAGGQKQWQELCMSVAAGIVVFSAATMVVATWEQDLKQNQA
jgi:hypothetical protein